MTGLVLSELLKLRTIRAPLGLALAVIVVSGLAVAATVGADALESSSRELDIADAAEVSSILAMILGILLVTNEYRHGTITPTFLVAPARERVLTAKLIAAGIAGVLIGCLAALVAFAIAIPWLATDGDSLGGGDTQVAVLRLVGSFAFAALIGVAVGTLIHSQIGAIVATFAWFLLMEPLVWGLGELVDWSLRPYLPGSALDALISTDDELLSAPSGLLLSLAYVGALFAAGTLLTLRRDAD